MCNFARPATLLNDAPDGLALRKIVELLGNGDEERRRVRSDLADLRAMGLDSGRDRTRTGSAVVA